jgi:hypothetical protein
MAAKSITAFSFTSPPATGVISGSHIAVIVPVATDVTALVATFTHTGSSVAVAGVAQTSAVTANDFTDGLTYIVTASDATTKEYTVTVTISQVTVAQIAQLRRMVGETDPNAVYTNALMTSYIDRYPRIDEEGEEPFTLSGDTPPRHIVNPDWMPTYDMNAAAADIWVEKATATVGQYDFNADGGSYSRSQQYDQYMKQARFYRARSMPTSARSHKWPDEQRGRDAVWIANNPEPRD